MSIDKKKIKLSDIIDIEFLQEFQDFFAKTTGVASITVDDTGPITKPSNFTDFCITYTRGSEEGYRRCNECDIRWGKVAAETSKPVIYSCHTGLTDFAVPIVVEGEHVASILGGQVLTKKPDLEHFRKLAQVLGINEEEYIEAVKKIKIVPAKQVDSAAKFLFLIANAISKIGYKNLQLIRRNEKEKTLREIISIIGSSLDLEEIKNEIVTKIGVYLGADRVIWGDFNPETEKYTITKQGEYKSSKKLKSVNGFDFTSIPGFIENIRTKHMHGEDVIYNDLDEYVNDNGEKVETLGSFFRNQGFMTLMAININYGDIYFGNIVVAFAKKVNINQEEIAFVKTIAEQAGIAVNQSKLYTGKELQIGREELLRKITETIIDSTDIDVTKQRIVELVGKTLNIDRVIIVEYDIELKKFLLIEQEYLSSDKIPSAIGSDVNEISPNFVEDIVKGKSTLVNDGKVTDILTSQKFEPEKEVIQNFQVNSLFNTPLTYKKELLGVLSVSYSHEHFIDDEEIALIKTVARQVSIAIHQARLFTENMKKIERENLLSSILSKAITTFDINEIKHVVKKIGQLTKADRCYFVEVDLENMKGKPINFEGEYLASEDIKSIIGYDFPSFDVKRFVELYSKNRNLVVFDYAELSKNSDEEYSGINSYSRTFNLKSGIGIPFIYMNKLTAVLCIEYVKEKVLPNYEELEFLKILGNQIGVIFNQMQQFKNAKDTAQRESLLRNIIDKIRRSLDLEEIMTYICKEISKLFDVQRIAITIFPNPKNYKEIIIKKEFIISSEIKGLLDLGDFSDIAEYWGNNLIKESKTISIDNVINSNTPNYFKEKYSSIGIKAMLATAIRKGEDIWGTLILSDYKKTRHWSEEDKLLLKTIADQVYIAINQAELYEKEKLMAKRENVLRQIIETIRGTIDINQMKKRIVTAIGETFKVDRCIIHEFNQYKNKFEIIDEFSEYKALEDIKSYVGIDIEKPELKFFRDMFASGKEMLISNWTEHLEQLENIDNETKEWISSLSIKSDYVFPIIFNNKLLAAFYLTYTKEKVILSDDDLNDIRMLTNQIAIALYQAKLYKKNQLQTEREKLNSKIIETVRSSLDISKVQKKVTKEIGEAFHADRCYFRRYDKKADWVLESEFEYKASEEVESLLGIKPNKDLFNIFLEKVKKEKKGFYPIVVDRTRAKGTMLEEYMEKYNITEDYAIPIIDRYDEIFWLVLHYSKPGPNLTEEDKKLLETLAYQLDISFDQIKLYNDTKKLAEREAILRNTMEILRGTFDFEKIKTSFVEIIKKYFNPDRCIVEDYVPDLDKILPFRLEYLKSQEMKKLENIDVEESFPEFAKKVKQGRSIIIKDVEKTLARKKFVNYKSMETLQEYGVKSDYGIPIVYKGNFYGTLIQHYITEKRVLSYDEMAFLKTLVDQAGVAFYQAELYYSQKNIAEREKLTREITERIRSSLNLDETLSFICEELTKIFRVQRSTITVPSAMDSNGSSMIRREYITSENIEGLGNKGHLIEIRSYWEKLLDKNSVVGLDNIEKSDVPGYFKDFYKELGVKSIIGASIKKGENVLGILVLSEYNEYRHWTAEERELLEIISSQIYIAINQAELYAKTKKNAEREQSLRRIVNIFRQTLDIDEIKKTFVNEVGKYFNADRCFIYEFGPNIKPGIYFEYTSSQDVKRMSEADFNKPQFKYWEKVMFEENISTGTFCPDLQQFIIDNNLQNTPVDEHRVEFDIKTAIGIPIVYIEQTFGSLIVQYTKEVTNLTEEDITFLRSLAEQASIALHQGELYKEIQAQAERERISRNIIEILRSSIDKTIIKKLFVKNIGKFFNADRVFFSEYDHEKKMYLPVDENSEYLSSPEEKSFVGFDWSIPEIQSWIRPLLEKREMKIVDWDEYVKEGHEINESILSLYRETSTKSKYGFPVIYQDSILGFFCIEFTQKAFKLNDEDIGRIRSICTQAGVALYHADLYSKAQECYTSKESYKVELLSKIEKPAHEILDISLMLTQNDFERQVEMEYLKNIINSCNQLLELTHE